MGTREMKDSGIEWIGQIPKDWKVCRIKNAGSIYGGLTGKAGDDFKVDEGDKYAYFIQFTNIFNNTVIDINNLAKVKVSNNENQNNVSQGDILILMSSEDNEGIAKSALLNTDEIQPLYLNSFCKGLHLNQCSYYPSYINYYLISDAGHVYNQLHSNGFIRINLRQDKLLCCPLLTPNYTEQQCIATFLDEKCKDIDTLITLQEEMIAELQAYKQSVISEAVTKGLNPNVTMKDSGVDWVDKIPAKWNVAKMKYIVSLKSGSNLTSYQISDNGEYPVYGGNGLRGYYHNYSNEGNYVLVGRQGALCGNINYTNGKFWVTEHALVCYPRCEFVVKWLGELLRAMNLNQYSLSAAQPGLSAERIMNLYMPVPPLSEQRQIADYLDTKCSQIDELIALKQQKITELQDYKKSLIYEYVTGKKEVPANN